MNLASTSTRKMRVWLLAALALGVLAVAAVMSTSLVQASSHREAPAISKDAAADNTDTWVFIPQGVTDTIVLAASWSPFEGPEGGPNYFEFDSQVLYDIYVDIDGDAMAEVTYTLQANTTIRDPLNTFLYNTGPINSVGDLTWNRPQTYTLTETFEPGLQPGAGRDHVQMLVQDQFAPPANIGNKSIPNYDALVAETIYTYTDAGNGDEIQVFAGATDDAFWVDLQVFDLLTLRGQDFPIGYMMDNEPVDSLAGFNAHSIVIELPIDRLTRDGETVLGVWAGARRTGMGVFAGDGNPVQVSRLGMPLVNEVVLPMGLKDTFNAIPPSVDLTVYDLLQESVENPEVGTLLCALYGVPLPGDMDDDCNTEYDAGTPRTGRGDIFDIFLTGMVLTNPFTITTAGGPFELPAGFNVNQPASVVPAEMIRINTAVSGDLCHPTPQRLGVLAGDACGFPNGRRLIDDVIEIELLAVAGAAYEVLDDRDDTFSFNPAFIAVLDDGLNGNDVPFAGASRMPMEFPYMAPAQSGQSHIHQNQPDVQTAIQLGSMTSAGLTDGPAIEIALGLVGLMAFLTWVYTARIRPNAKIHRDNSLD